ncbi:MAG: PDZ domain-containing protein [Pedobacter sp.]|nr:MAG: PDZ domain-containing protein [Pedobacter sp.]
MKKILLITLSLCICTWCGFSQQLAVKQIQLLTKVGIKKAYPASIRMWAFDTVKNQQAGPQFSAVVVTSDGHILTAAHVNTPGQTYMVTFPSGKTCIAQGLGKIEYEQTPMMPDVAMMRIITPGKWPYAEMGWSSTIKINEPVISISYPESLNQPLPLVRFGSVTNLKNEYGFLQSTCMMEPGDSGGPVFDYLGRVIGLHSAINGDVDYEVPVDLYRKYWTALNLQKVYPTLPEHEDSIGNDPIKVMSFPQLASLNKNFFKTAELFAGNVVSIESTDADKSQQVLGTLIKSSKLTYIISKSSLIGANPIVKLVDGKTISAKVLYRDKNTDLILLEPVIKIKGGINLSTFVKDTLNSNQLGDFLISVLPDTKDTEVSVIGSTKFSLNKVAAMPFLGAAVAYKQPVEITVIQPGSPAANAGLQVGDQVVSIDSAAIHKPENYGDQLIKYWKGDTIKFDVIRQGNRISNQIVLSSRPERPITHPADLFKGGKSNRRDGFENVFVQSTRIKPEQCGGPVIDMMGNFYGINIARFSRTSTIVTPASVILSFINASLTFNNNNNL